MVEFCGEAIRDLSMEGRMTLCNMAIEMGAKAGLVAPDETTFNYVKGRLHAPKGKDFDDAVAYWKTLQTDEGATFDTVVTLQAEEISPQVTRAPIRAGDFRERQYSRSGFVCRSG